MTKFEQTCHTVIHTYVHMSTYNQKLFEADIGKSTVRVL